MHVQIQVNLIVMPNDMQKARMTCVFHEPMMLLHDCAQDALPAGTHLSCRHQMPLCASPQNVSQIHDPPGVSASEGALPT